VRHKFLESGERAKQLDSDKARNKSSKRTQKAWTEEEINFLKENWRKMTYLQMAPVLGRNRNAIGTEAKRLGLVKYHHLSEMKWTPQKDEFLRKNYADMSRKELARKLGCSTIAVKSRLKVLEIKKQWSKIFKPDLSALLETDKAYLAGLVDGEGYIGIHKQRVQKGKYLSYRPSFGISMNRKEVDTLREVADTLEKAKFKLHIRTRRNASATDLSTHSMPTLLALAEMLIPYSKTKKKHWLLLKEYIQSRMSHPMKPYTPREIEISDEIRLLNQISKLGRKKSMKI
jgi:hypothetical protein